MLIYLPEEGICRKYAVTRREGVEHLIERSRRFLETAEYQIDRGFYDLAAFSLEQALQPFLKSRLLENGVDYLRTHSVRTLLEILQRVVSEDKKEVVRDALSEYLLELGILEDAYITSRYVMREFREEEVRRLLQVVKEVMRAVA